MLHPNVRTSAHLQTCRARLHKFAHLLSGPNSQFIQSTREFLQTSPDFTDFITHDSLQYQHDYSAA